MLNQLLIPQPGTLHQALTFEDIDLSAKKFGIKSHKRATLLEFMNELLSKNDNVLTHMVTKQGNWAKLIVVYKDGNCISHQFRLERYSYYDPDENDYTRYIFRDYLAKILSQTVHPYSVDYQHAKSFVSL